MKRLSLIVVLPALLFLHCGGIDSHGGEANAAEVGNEAEGQEVLESTKNAAITAGSTANQKAVVAVDAGYAGNGTTISIPSGFTAAQCKFTASPANVDGSAISTSASINSTTGAVVCKKVVQEREEIPPETKDCTASYTVICVRETAQ